MCGRGEGGVCGRGEGAVYEVYVGGEGATNVMFVIYGHSNKSSLGLSPTHTITPVDTDAHSLMHASFLQPLAL